MWKSLSTIAICTSLVTNSFANEQKVRLDVSCYSPEAIAKIIEKFQEEYVFFGIDDIHKVKNLTSVLFLNKETGSYSFVFHANDQGLVCVISSGNKGNLLKKE